MVNNRRKLLAGRDPWNGWTDVAEKRRTSWNEVQGGIIIIDEPGGDLYYGSDVAAPVFADVMAESLRLLAVPPDALPALDSGSVMQAMSQ